MDYQEYLQRSQQPAQLVEVGEYSAAQTLLRSLLASDPADRDKAISCLNSAIVYDKLNELGEALKWYDAGIALERRQGGDFMAESKAVYLAAGTGRREPRARHARRAGGEAHSSKHHAAARAHGAIAFVTMHLPVRQASNLCSP